MLTETLMSSSAKNPSQFEYFKYMNKKFPFYSKVIYVLIICIIIILWIRFFHSKGNEAQRNATEKDQNERSWLTTTHKTITMRKNETRHCNRK